MVAKMNPLHICWEAHSPLSCQRKNKMVIQGMCEQWDVRDCGEIVLTVQLKTVNCSAWSGVDVYYRIPICTTAQMTKVCKKHKFIIEFLIFQITRMCKCWFSVQILLYDFGAWPQVPWIACISMILQKWSMKCNLQLTNNAQGVRMTRVSSNSFKIMHWSCVANGCNFAKGRSEHMQ